MTVGYKECYRMEVRVNIGKLTGIQIHIGGTGNCSDSLGGAIKREGSALIQWCAVSGVETAHTVFLTIIFCGVYVTDNGHRRIDGRYRLITICHVEYYTVEVRICIGKLFFCQTHIGGAFICPACR